MERLKKKFETAKQYVPKPVVHSTKGATVGIMAYGSTESAINEARAQLARDHGIKTDFMRVRAVPFAPEVDEFVKNYDQIFVVEMNRDGQLHQLLSLAYPKYALTLKSVAFGDGMPASAKWIREGILARYTPRKKAVSAKPAKKAVAKKLPVKKAAQSGKKGAK